MKIGLSVGLVAALSLPSRAALAQAEAPARARFGDRGEFVMQSDATIQLNGSRGGPPRAFVLVTPALDYFVVHSVSLGAQLGWYDDDGTKEAWVAPRIGFNITISDNLSLWIKCYVGYERAWDGLFNVTADITFFEAFAPLLWHPAPHFFLGGGPYVEPSFVFNTPNAQNNQNYVAYGLTTTVGGWFIP